MAALVTASAKEGKLHAYGQALKFIHYMQQSGMGKVELVYILPFSPSYPFYEETFNIIVEFICALNMKIMSQN